MSDHDAVHEDPTQALEDLESAKNEAIGRGHHRTACRLATEIKRKAKEFRELAPYAGRCIPWPTRPAACSTRKWARMQPSS